VPQSALTQEAEQLLLEAASDPHGTILKFEVSGGKFIGTNSKKFGGGWNDARAIARWNDALGLLVGRRLVSAQGDKGEAFTITSAGFEMADQLRAAQRL
jgi:hypothetical protein